MMKIFKSTKSDKVMEQSDSWFPARSADLLVACRLTQCHTIGATQCHSAKVLYSATVPHPSFYPTVRSLHPPTALSLCSSRQVLRINFDPLKLSDPNHNRFPRWVSSRARGRWTSQAPQKRGATPQQR